MDFIQSGIRQLANQLIQHRKYNYCEDALDQFIDSHPNVICKHSIIKNKRGQSLSTMILKRSPSDTCIVYAHGLGSNKIEVLSLARYMEYNDYHFCSFDFSGSGRSDGDHTTYGLRQQDDVNAILGALDVTRQYKKYILWGRSMGGAAIVLSQSRNLNPKVQCIILDSPFSSFEKAAIEIAAKNSIFPQRMLSFLISPLKQHMQKQHRNLNPFCIDICKSIGSIQSKIMLIYSKDDSIVSYSHSKQISKFCRKNPIQLEITEDHNKPRKTDTYIKALDFIRTSIEYHNSRVKRSRSRGRGISVSSKENSPYYQNSNSSVRRSMCNSNNSDKMSILNEVRNGRNGNCVNIGIFDATYKQFSPKNYTVGNMQNNNSIIKSVVLQTHESCQKKMQNSIKMKTMQKYKGILA